MPGASSPTFTIPRSFSPSHSVVGRLIRRRSGDRLRGEALYFFAVTMAIVVWLLAGFAAWAMLADRITADPTGSAGLTFFGIQIAIPILGILVAGIGFRPQIRVELDGRRLLISRGRDRLEIPLDTPFTLQTVDAVAYHRGLRLLESTRPFINRPVEANLLITSSEYAVVLGLAPEDREALKALLSEFACVRSASVDRLNYTASASMPASTSAPTRARIVSSLADVPESGSR